MKKQTFELKKTDYRFVVINN